MQDKLYIQNQKRIMKSDPETPCFKMHVFQNRGIFKMFSNEVSTEAKSLKRRCLTCRRVLERSEACRWMTFYHQTVLPQIVLNRKMHFV